MTTPTSTTPSEQDEQDLIEIGEKALPYDYTVDQIQQEVDSWSKTFAPYIADDNLWYYDSGRLDGKDSATLGELFEALQVHLADHAAALAQRDAEIAELKARLSRVIQYHQADHALMVANMEYEMGEISFVEVNAFEDAWLQAKSELQPDDLTDAAPTLPDYPSEHQVGGAWVDRYGRVWSILPPSTGNSTADLADAAPREEAGR